MANIALASVLLLAFAANAFATQHTYDFTPEHLRLAKRGFWDWFGWGSETTTAQPAESSTTALDEKYTHRPTSRPGTPPQPEEQRTKPAGRNSTQRFKPSYPTMKPFTGPYIRRNSTTRNSTGFPGYYSTQHYGSRNSTRYPTFNSTHHYGQNATTTRFPSYNGTQYYGRHNTTRYPGYNSTHYYGHNTTTTRFPSYNGTQHYGSRGTTRYPSFNSTQYYGQRNSTQYPRFNSTQYDQRYRTTRRARYNATREEYQAAMDAIVQIAQQFAAQK